MNQYWASVSALFCGKINQPLDGQMIVTFNLFYLRRTSDSFWLELEQIPNKSFLICLHKLVQYHDLKAYRAFDSSGDNMHISSNQWKYLRIQHNHEIHSSQYILHDLKAAGLIDWWNSHLKEQLKPQLVDDTLQWWGAR